MSEARQPEEPFARDPLAIRLQQLDDLPMSHELLPRVLSGAHALKVPVWRRFRGTAVLAGALVVLVAVVAATPLTRGYVGELLDQMGLRQTPAGLASATGYGQNLRVIAGIDDGQVVMVDLRAYPGTAASSDGAVVFGPISASDATGRDLVIMGWQGNQADGADEAMLWFRRPAGAAAAGTPITLHVSTGRGPASWTLRFSLPATKAPASYPVPAPGKVGKVSVTFTEVRASGSYVMVAADLIGPDERAIVLVAGPTGLVDPSGGHVPNAHAWDDGGVPVPGGVRVHTEWYWPRQGSGTYRLVVGPGEGPHLVRPISIHSI